MEYFKSVSIEINNKKSRDAIYDCEYSPNTKSIDIVKNQTITIMVNIKSLLLMVFSV